MNVVYHSLQQENELLRSRVAQLEHDLEQQETTSTEKNKKNESELIQWYKQQLEAMQHKLDQSYNHYHHSNNNEQFIPNRWKKVFEDTISQEQEKSEKLQRIVHFCVRELSELNEKLQTLQKAVLPTISKEMISRILHNTQQLSSDKQSASLFESDNGSLRPTKQSTATTTPLNNSNGMLCREEFVLVRDHIEKLENNIYVLDMVTKAKMESLALVNQKLRTQVTDLQTDYHMHMSEKKRGINVLENTQKLHAEEKEKVRDQMTQLRNLYETQKLQLTEEVNRRNIELQKVKENQEELLKLYSELEDQKSVLSEEKEELEKKLALQESARIQLATELSEHKRLLEYTKEELSILKLSQKFGVLGILGEVDTGGNHQISPERLNLMKMANQLMEDNAKLKQENANLDVELKRVKSFLPPQPVTTTTTTTMQNSMMTIRNSSTRSFVPPVLLDQEKMKQHEISMVAEDRLSLDVLTSKVLSDMMTLK
jgi:hypothetical protein